MVSACATFCPPLPFFEFNLIPTTQTNKREFSVALAKAKMLAIVVDEVKDLMSVE